MSKFTKTAIINTFLNLLETKSLDKISIKDLIIETGINRNTFYYYYQDIYALLNDIFNEEVIKFKENLNENSTFYEEYSKASNLFLQKRVAILHIYQSKSRDLINRYLNEVVTSFLEKFVRKDAKSQNLSNNQIQYIINFYKYSIIGNTMHWIEEGLPQYREDIIKMISRTYEATINSVIDDVKKAGTGKFITNLEYR